MSRQNKKSWEAREGHIPWGAWKWVGKGTKGEEPGGMTERKAIKVRVGC